MSIHDHVRVVSYRWMKLLLGNVLPPSKTTAESLTTVEVCSWAFEYCVVLAMSIDVDPTAAIKIAASVIDCVL